MPRVQANGITIYYEQQGSGEPLFLLPFLSADHACYAFQVAEYAKHFTCISLDLRGTGESDKPEGVYSTGLFADDVAALMSTLGIHKTHVMGLSLGAGVSIRLAAKYPEKIKSLSLHGGWTKTDAFLKTVIESWQVVARALGSVPETTIQAIFPWCFTPELYASRPDYIQSLADFIRSRPAQPVQSFVQHTNAILKHDAEAELERITAPTQITVGSQDILTSIRFSARMKEKIRKSELLIFEGCAHAPLYEKLDEFNQKTLEFLLRRAVASAA
jgi:pimeloyl-ACP methyl ester carboxylesterase